jgi:hypothetical protein
LMRSTAGAGSMLDAGSRTIGLSPNLGGEEWSSLPGMPDARAGGGKKGGGGAANKALEDYLTAVKEATTEQKRLYAEETATLDRELRRRITSLEDYTEQAKQIRTNEFNEHIDRINEQLKAVEMSTLKRAEKDKKIAALDREAAAATSEYLRVLEKLEDDKNEKIEEAGLAHKQRMADLDTAFREREIDRIREGVEKGAIERAKGYDEIEKLAQESFEAQQDIFALELELAGQNLQKRQEVLDRMRAADVAYTLSVEENARRRREALIGEVGLGTPPDVIRGTGVSDALSGTPEALAAAAQSMKEAAGQISQAAQDFKRAAEIIKEIGEAPPPKFDAWAESFKFLKEVGKDAFTSLAEGIGSLVQNWVLLGETGPAAMKKLLASVLASVAAEAAVRAIFELAKGFAALFFNPAEAAAHFTAAALFGSIAGVSAVAGRAIAGDAFRNDARDATGAPNQSRLAAADRPAAQDVGRTRGEGGIVIRVESRPQPGTIIETFVNDYRDNGRSRGVIQGDGVLAT